MAAPDAATGCRPGRDADDRREQGENMPLTPEDVSKKRFTPVRLREGYDMGEVDQFLDEVESELERLLKENEDLRSKVTAGGGTAPATTATSAARAGWRRAGRPGRPRRPRRPPRPPPAARAVTPPPSEQIHVTTAAEASSAATRLLELATRNADEVVAEARTRPRRSSPPRAPTPSASRPRPSRAPSSWTRTPAGAPSASTPRPTRVAARPSATSRRRRAASTARWRTCAPSSASTAAA